MPQVIKIKNKESDLSVFMCNLKLIPLLINYLAKNIL